MDLLYIVVIFIFCAYGAMTLSDNEDSTSHTDYGSSSTLPVLILGAIHAGVSIAALVEMDSDPVPNPIRMPHSVVPLHYNVYLASEPERDISWGHVHILVNAALPAETIVLHAKRLDLDEETLVITDEATRNPIGIKSLEYEVQNEWYIIGLLSPLHQNRHYTISVAFERQEAMRNDGLSWLKYKSGNEFRWLVFTQFEPSGARNVFPCFDEPAIKARFNISVATPPGMHALSNMPLREATEPVKEIPGWVWSHFEESLPMSTYLVAFAITDFVRVKTEKPTNFSVWGPAELQQNMQLVADRGPDILKALEEFTGIKYPLPKLDNVVIPGASSSYSGLENWGLITYRNDELSVDKDRSNSQDIRNALELVAHEAAHMWFGNLVTPAWWDHLWLKEGFANYGSFKAVTKVLDDQYAEGHFVTNSLHSAFQRDAGRMAMNQGAANLVEIERKYNIHSYEKGAVMVRMMEHILTTKVFEAGVRQYLQEYSYQTAAATDLFRVLEDAAENDPHVLLPSEVGLSGVMDSWVTQGGYPLITVTRHYDNGSATVCQQIFPSAFLANKTNSWWVPLSYTTQNEADFKHTAPRVWLPANQSCVIITGLPGKDQWVIFNILQTGYYRVNYDTQNWMLLINFLNSDQYQNIHAVNRAQLLDDAFSLSRFGLMQLEMFQNLTEYLYQETSPTSWLSLLQHDALCHKLKENSTLLETALALGIEMQGNKEEGSSHLWYKVIDIVCEKTCVSSWMDDGYELFAAFKENPVQNRINPDLRYRMLCSAMADHRATEEDLSYLWEMGRNSTLQGEKYDILMAMQNCPFLKPLQQRFVTLLGTGDEWIEDQIPLILSSIQSLGCERNAINAVSQLLEVIKFRKFPLSTVMTPIIEKLTILISDIGQKDEKIGQVWCKLITAMFATALGP